ncbi:hypothetical protein [Rhizobium leguminosarum]|uniref:hypothetical protein n=1 Tax=Rhizobium leguminosarum TaxID=384 RepID=UPI002E102100|nr:hypothetical protein U8Q02_40130 [Rhizobium leguminosarum]
MTGRNDMITIKGTMPVAEAVELQRLVDEGRPVKLTGKIVLSQEDSDTLTAIMNAETNDTVELLKIAGLDPATDLVYSNFEDVDWLDHDLAGYNFDGAKLSRGNFSRVKNIELMSYVGADIEDVIWPEGYVADNGAGD